MGNKPRKTESLIFVRKEKRYLGRLVADEGHPIANFFKHIAKRDQGTRWYWVFSPENYQKFMSLPDPTEIVEGTSIYTAGEYRQQLEDAVRANPGELKLKKGDCISGLETEIYKPMTKAA